MSDLNVFLADAAAADADMRGSEAVLTLKNGTVVPLTDAVVLTDTLQTRETLGDKALQYPVIVQIPKGSYPDPGPTIGGDRIEFYLREGDAVKTTRRIAELLAQTNGMWTFGLD